MSIGDPKIYATCDDCGDELEMGLTRTGRGWDDRGIEERLRGHGWDVSAGGSVTICGECVEVREEKNQMNAEEQASAVAGELKAPEEDEQEEGEHEFFTDVDERGFTYRPGEDVDFEPEDDDADSDEEKGFTWRNVWSRGSSE